MTATVVILTLGDRPEQLARAIASVRSQSRPAEIVVVANGAEFDTMKDATVVRLPANIGIPGGRNKGVEATDAEIVFFLDDDAAYDGDTVVADVEVAFDSDPRLGLVSLRVSDEGGGAGQRRHVPRLRARDPQRSSDVTTFLGGACAMRRSLFEEIGVFPDTFFYGHEESDFAWRALDAGYRIRYRGDIGVVHPSAPAARHAEYFFRSSRNRVWLARRRLPLLLGAVYVCVWFVLSLVRPGHLRGWRSTLEGFRAGFSEPAGGRAPMRWATALEMLRVGRPPVI